MPATQVSETTRQRSAVFARHATAIRWSALALAVVALLLFLRVLPLEQIADVLRGWIEGLGAWGPAALGLIYVVATLLMFPGWVLTVAAGALFGLLWGTVVVSLGSTLGAALAFLIARYAARDRVARQLGGSRKFRAVDRAIGEGGWKIVALLRLSPAIPFNLQNYLYGLTPVCFWPYVLASWAAMLPGTFLYVYLGWLGGAGLQAAAGDETAGLGMWMLRGVGLLATLAVVVYITRLARRTLKEQAGLEESAEAEEPKRSEPAGMPWISLGTLAASLVLLALSFAALARGDAVRESVGRLLELPPQATMTEAHEEKPDGQVFDHSQFEPLLERHVDEEGWVDYRGLQKDEAQLDAYIASLAEAPFDELGRDEKLALLINAYNAFTLKLILEWYPVESIKDIPAAQRWDDVRWRVGPHTWSLNQIEHEEIRPKFVEPRIHFALVCAAVGCPPLRRDAYTGDRLEEQLEERAQYVHDRPRWFRFDAERNEVYVTELYQWYRGDFEQVAGSVVEYAARYSPELKRALDAGERPRVRWITYDWALNEQQPEP